MPVKKLKDFLDANHVEFVSISHSKAYSSQKIAASAHISGKVIAKTVMIKINGNMAMAVLPGAYKVDFDMLRVMFGTRNVVMASESEFIDRFPDCELGAMPPFGNLYDMEVYVAEALTADKEIAFNAGTHSELIKLAYHDYERLVKPKVLKFSYLPVSFPHDPRERWEDN